MQENSNTPGLGVIQVRKLVGSNTTILKLPSDGGTIEEHTQSGSLCKYRQSQEGDCEKRVNLKKGSYCHSVEGQKECYNG